MSKPYSEKQLDALKEVINIGGGHAATSISQLIEKPVHMTVPVIEALSYEEIFEQIMTEDTIVKAVLTKILGDAPGAFLFVGKQEDLNDVAKMMLPVDIAADEEMTNSALKELVNIIVNAFLNAVTKLLDLQLLSSVPLLTRDLFGSIVSSVYLEQGQYDDTILIIKLEFFYMGNRVESSLYYVPQSRNLEKLFALLGV
ncbi:chemotaxis protein CheC [Pisciglobus halotolerans]|uniref:Chemotaxis protein CheC n=1 Tax=Pisciglobus halotolerans TaxID=745365 RepID=A0A1I3APQ1_9LACT|nr:chemotaxis protein CheC [Pisciglobus halotolerans]SFH51699.1 chemotaxis protein CheC [Pisciglobus halotolerans]